MQLAAASTASKAAVEGFRRLLAFELKASTGLAMQLCSCNPFWTQENDQRTFRLFQSINLRAAPHCERNVSQVLGQSSQLSGCAVVRGRFRLRPLLHDLLPVHRPGHPASALYQFDGAVLGHFQVAVA
jgi:hypothetical protein